MEVKTLSVFFPLFNEEGNITETVGNALSVLKNLPLKEYEVIIVDDGSLDQTGQIADRLAKENKKIKVIHQANGGYGMALRAGFYNSLYDFVVYTDGDGQFDFNEVLKFLELTDQADLIIGYRIKRRDPFFRVIFAKGWALSLFIFFGLKLKDVDCGFKLISKTVLDTIPKLESERGGMVNAELAIKAKRAGFRIAQVGVNHYPRKSGRPTGASVKVIINSYKDLIKLWFKTVFSRSLKSYELD